MTNIKITIGDDNGTGAPLFHQYAGQCSPQGAYLEIDPSADTATYEYNGEIGNGVPMNVWHRNLLRVSVSPCALRTALEDTKEDEVILSLLRAIVDGHETKWDGSNYVGTLTDAAEAALEKLEQELEKLTQAEVWAASEWIEAGFSMGEIAEKGFEACAAEAEAAADVECAVLGNLTDAYVSMAIDKARSYISCEREGDADVLAVIKLLVERDADNQILLDDYIAEFGESA